MFKSPIKLRKVSCSNLQTVACFSTTLKQLLTAVPGRPCMPVNPLCPLWPLSPASPASPLSPFAPAGPWMKATGGQSTQDWSNTSKVIIFIYVIDAHYVMMNVQQNHGHQQDQQGRKDQQYPKEKSHHNTIRSYLQIRLPDLIPFFNRLKQEGGLQSLHGHQSCQRGRRLRGLQEHQGVQGVQPYHSHHGLPIGVNLQWDNARQLKANVVFLLGSYAGLKIKWPSKT